MAATEKKNIWQWSGDAPEVQVGRITASQGAYMAGAPCDVCTSCTLTLGDTADGSDGWHGFLCECQATELAGSTEVKWVPIVRDALYAVYVESSGTDSAVVQSRVGDQYGLKVSTTAGQIGYTTLDVGNANAIVQVMDLAFNVDSARFSSADDPGVALVVFLDSVVDSTKA